MALKKAADVWSLGVILWQVATRQTPDSDFLEKGACAFVQQRVDTGSSLPTRGNVSEECHEKWYVDLDGALAPLQGLGRYRVHTARAHPPNWTHPLCLCHAQPRDLEGGKSRDRPFLPCHY